VAIIVKYPEKACLSVGTLLALVNGGFPPEWWWFLTNTRKDGLSLYTAVGDNQRNSAVDCLWHSTCSALEPE
jgi:hypothetical protein